MSDQSAPSVERDKPQKRSGILGDVVAGLSLANLCLLEVWRELFSPPADRFYFVRDLLLIDYAAALLAVCCLWLLFFLLLFAARRGWPRFLWKAMITAFVLLALNLVRLESNISKEWIQGVLGAPTSLAVLGLLAWLAWKERAHLFEGLRIVLIALAPFSLATLSLLGSGAVEAWTRPTSPDPSPSLDSNVVEHGGSPARTVVLLFDELDERLINPRTRPKQLELPELDRLREESTVFNNATRAGDKTMIAVPALTTGVAVAAAVPLGTRDMELAHEAGKRSWRNETNIFDAAASGGFGVHIVGWYLPYCRIFSGLDSCSWQPHFLSFGGHSEGLSDLFFENIYSMSPVGRRRLSAAAYRQILEGAVRAVRQSGLIWVHMPIPHLPSIYNPTTKRTTWWATDKLSGYLDNLRLTDETLGTIRRTMGADWDASTVLLISDHNWRQSGAFDGASTTRVPLYVKLPGGSSRDVDLGTTARIVPFIALASLRNKSLSIEDLVQIAQAGATEGLR